MIPPTDLTDAVLVVGALVAVAIAAVGGLALAMTARATRRDRAEDAVRGEVRSTILQRLGDPESAWAAWAEDLSPAERRVAESVLAEFLRQLDGSTGEDLAAAGAGLGLGERARWLLREGKRHERLEALTWLTLLEEPVPVATLRETCSHNEDLRAAAARLLHTVGLPESGVGRSGDAGDDGAGAGHQNEDASGPGGDGGGAPASGVGAGSQAAGQSASGVGAGSQAAGQSASGVGAGSGDADLRGPEQEERANAAAVGTDLLLADPDDPLSVFGLDTLYRLTEYDPSPLLERVDGATGWDPSLQVQVLDVVAHVAPVDPETSLSWVVDRLSAGSPEVRAAAARALQQYGWRGDVREAAELTALRDDPSPAVREALCELLAAWGDPDARESLRAILREEPDDRVRLVAARELHGIDADLDVGALPAPAERTWRWVRADASVREGTP